jgi:ATP-dependent DNA ligase
MFHDTASSFDLLELDGDDLQRLPIEVRKGRLSIGNLISNRPSCFIVVPSTVRQVLEASTHYPREGDNHSRQDQCNVPEF